MARCSLFLAVLLAGCTKPVEFVVVKERAELRLEPDTKAPLVETLGLGESIRAIPSDGWLTLEHGQHRVYANVGDFVRAPLPAPHEACVNAATPATQQGLTVTLGERLQVIGQADWLEAGWSAVLKNKKLAGLVKSDGLVVPDTFGDYFVVILGGGKTRPDAITALERYEAMKLRPLRAAPKAAVSDNIIGLNPGFHIAILGFAQTEAEAKQIAAYTALSSPGAYYRPVQGAFGCDVIYPRATLGTWSRRVGAKVHKKGHLKWGMSIRSGIHIAVVNGKTILAEIKYEQPQPNRYPPDEAEWDCGSWQDPLDWGGFVKIGNYTYAYLLEGSASMDNYCRSQIETEAVLYGIACGELRQVLVAGKYSSGNAPWLPEPGTPPSVDDFKAVGDAINGREKIAVGDKTFTWSPADCTYK